MAYWSDVPKTDKSEDLLQRAAFADRIASMVAGRQGRPSAVVGIYGKWGEGKTTTLNFIVQSLKHHPNVVPVRFDPWAYQSEEQIVASFFSTLAVAMEAHLQTNAEYYGGILRKIGSALSGISFGLGPFNVSPGGMVTALGEALPEQTLEGMKKTLQASLQAEGKHLVVFIDDVDRLDDDGVRVIFKLVKTATDFDNTTFVLAFDPAVVTKALRRNYSGHAEPFIEKIVQVPLYLPEVSEGIIPNVLADSIDNLLQHGTHGQEATYRFFDMLRRHIGRHVRTLRTVGRIVNAIEFTLPLLAGEADLADVLAIETVRIVFPRLYEFIRAHKLELTQRVEREGREHVESVLNTLLDATPEHERLDAREILMELFPHTKYPFANTLVADDAPLHWRNAGRICSPEYFERYFIYGVPAGDISDSRMRELLESGEQGSDVVTAALRRLIEEVGTATVVNKLQEWAGRVDPSAAEAFAMSVASISQNMGAMSRQGPYNDSLLQAEFFTRAMLGKLSGPARSAALTDIVRSAWLPYAGDVFRFCRGSANWEPLILEPELSAIGHVLADRIRRDDAEHPLLVTMPAHAPVLYIEWWRVDQEGARTRISEICNGDAEMATALIRAFAPVPLFIREALESLDNLVDGEVLVRTLLNAFPNAAEGVREDSTDDERQAAAFVGAYRAWKGQVGDGGAPQEGA